MSSNILSTSYQLYERQKYGQCFQSLLPIFFSTRYQEPQLEAYKLMSDLLGRYTQLQELHLDMLKKATGLFSSDQKPSPEQNRINGELQLQLIRMLIDSGSLEEAQNNLKCIISKNIYQGEEAFFWILEQYDRMLEDAINKKKIQSKYSNDDQIEHFKRLSQEAEEQNYFKNDGLFAYLIPMKWLRRWKGYVEFKDEHDILQEKQDIDLFNECSEEEINRFKEIFSTPSDATIEEETSNHPGPIDSSQFIKIIWDLVIDPFSPKKYTNYVIQENLQENKDFLFVSYKVFNFFQQIYGAFEVKRMIVEHPQSRHKYVDVNNKLQRKMVSFMPVPKLRIFDKYRIFTVTVGAQENFDFLIKKLTKIYAEKTKIDSSKFPNSRFWKFSSLDAQNEWISAIKGTDQRLAGKKINGKFIDMKQVFEDYNIADSDVLVFEMKTEKEWQLLPEQNTLSQSSSSPTKTPQAIQKLMDGYGISSVPRITSESRKGLTGLQNLGNTCFMNSALQCLSNTYELTEFMTSNEFIKDLNPQNPLGTRGYLATTYAELIKSMWFGKQSSVSAWELKRVIGKFAPQFYGYGQQDSHELLSYLLDGLHEDLNRVVNKPTVENLEVENETDSEASEKFWQNYRKRNDSKIVDCMVGQYKSTLICPRCNRKSKTFDPFMSISLPIPSYQMLQIQLYFIYIDTNNIPVKINLYLSSDHDAREIANQLNKMLDIPTQEMDMILVKDHKIKDRVDQRKSVKWIHDHEGILFIQQLNKRAEQLSQDEAIVQIYYTQKAKAIYESDKILSFVRQLVINRKQSILELNVAVYQMFRPHFILMLKELGEKALPSQLLNKIIENTVNDENLLEEILMLQKEKKLPYILKISDTINKTKPQEFEFIQFNAPLISFSSSIKVDMYFSDYVKTDLLKLQRCKQHAQNSSTAETPKRKGDYHLTDCLQAFTREEILGKGDEWYCSKCKEHMQATKKMEIYRAPQILVLHLKRFKTNRIQNLGSYYFSSGSQKIGSLVGFPVEKLDLNEYVLSKQNGDKTDYTYDLFGVTNHFGGLGGGHYTATGFNPLTQRWVDFNDASVRAASGGDIVTEAAYLLFYRRRGAKTCQLGRQ